MDPIQTPAEGTELQEQATPQAGPEMETPQVPDEAAQTPNQAAPTEDASQQQPVTPQSPDYKQKFTESQREAILLNERVKVATTRLDSLTKQDSPTDEAMRKLYPEWDQLDDYNKRVLIRQESSAMRAARLEADQQELKDRLKLDDQLDDVIESSEFASKLAGKEAAFRRFAKNPKNRGIEVSVLAKAFLFEPDESPVSTPEPNPTPMPTEALPTGSGGPRTPLKPKKISLEEAATIRKADYKRWKQLVEADAIEEIE
jgi:hypothetical protein